MEMYFNLETFPPQELSYTCTQDGKMTLHKLPLNMRAHSNRTVQYKREISCRGSGLDFHRETFEIGRPNNGREPATGIFLFGRHTCCRIKDRASDRSLPRMFASVKRVFDDLSVVHAGGEQVYNHSLSSWRVGRNGCWTCAASLASFSQHETWTQTRGGKRLTLRRRPVE